MPRRLQKTSIYVNPLNPGLGSFEKVIPNINGGNWGGMYNWDGPNIKEPGAETEPFKNFDAYNTRKFFKAHFNARSGKTAKVAGRKRARAPSGNPPDGPPEGYTPWKFHNYNPTNTPVKKRPVNRPDYKTPTKKTKMDVVGSMGSANLGAPASYSARRRRVKKIFPTKKKPSKGQRILKSLTPPRTLTFQCAGVAESGAALRTAEEGYGGLPSGMWTGVIGQIAGAKAVPGQNSFFAQFLFHGTVIEQLSASLRVASDAPSAIGTTGVTFNQNIWLGKYSCTHELHNPTSVACYVTRYELVPRVSTTDPYALFNNMAHGSGDDTLDPINTSNLVRQNRSRVTPGVNPNEFPLFKARYRIQKRTNFTMAPGATLTLPYKGVMNRRVSMADYRQKFASTPGFSTSGGEITVNGVSTTQSLANDRASFCCKGLTKIILYQIWGVPSVQSTADSTTAGSALSNRVTTTPAQLIIRSLVKYQGHGAVDTSRRYLNLQQTNDNLESATSAIVGQETSHTITVVNQI